MAVHLFTHDDYPCAATDVAADEGTNANFHVDWSLILSSFLHPQNVLSFHIRHILWLVDVPLDSVAKQLLLSLKIIFVKQTLWLNLVKISSYKSSSLTSFQLLVCSRFYPRVDDSANPSNHQFTEFHFLFAMRYIVCLARLHIMYT